VTCRQSVFETKKARMVFDGQIVVMSGVELGCPVRNLELTNQILKNDYDIVLASVHRIKGKKKHLSSLNYSREDNKPQLIMSRYYDDIIEMTEWNGFDVLAHVTYPLRYFPANKLCDYDIMQHKEQLEYIFKTLIKNGKAIEINTASDEYVTKGIVSNMHPCIELLKLYKQLGGEYVTVGSDAHNAYNVGHMATEAYDMLKEAGFKYVTIYQKREPLLVIIE
jgi:histidinol-phosphatase (PHP family)